MPLTNSGRLLIEAARDMTDALAKIRIKIWN